MHFRHLIHRRRQHETTGKNEPRQGGLQAEDGQEVPAEIERGAEIQHLIDLRRSW
jgi:hypothetical protein